MDQRLFDGDVESEPFIEHRDVSCSRFFSGERGIPSSCVSLPPSWSFQDVCLMAGTRPQEEPRNHQMEMCKSRNFCSTSLHRTHSVCVGSGERRNSFRVTGTQTEECLCGREQLYGR